ncbi:hypothetical protein SAY87_025902 [Trapa incisa]|uniref:Pentatricopeptide repeat-containing protein n=1 Tax=Trapa incisa TaxID=236973 RepID=A0AAN7GSQ3_9MYRT|nr:hypothetical protein SAY87_025902 [Trapa incisa]
MTLPFQSCSLIKLYATAGRSADAFQCLKELKKPDMACWGTLVSTLVHHSYSAEAISALKYLMESGVSIDEFILGSIFNCSADIASLHQTKSSHSVAAKTGYERQTFVASSIIDAYAKCGDICSARLAFDQSSETEDVIIYNAMIMGYAHNGFAMEAIEIFEKMKLADLLPSKATFVSLISACSHMGFIDQGCALFQSMKVDYGMQPSPDIFGSVVDMLSRGGHLRYAKKLVEEMPFPPWPGVLRSLLSGCTIHGELEISKWASEKVFQLDPENDATHILLSKVHCEAENWEDAAFVQRQMMDKGISKCPGHSQIQVQ